jgi:putative PIN family toxin of toxin-antitoxin system
MTSRRKVRVFLDTNVIFSGLYSSRGAPAAILERFIEGRISVVISQQVLEELVRTIKEKLPEGLPALRKLLTGGPPEIQADPSSEQIEKLTGKLQFADAAILAAAINAKVDYFITGDSHFLENADLAKECGLKIVTPAQFLKVIG